MFAILSSLKLYYYFNFLYWDFLVFISELQNFYPNSKNGKNDKKNIEIVF